MQLKMPLKVHLNMPLTIKLIVYFRPMNLGKYTANALVICIFPFLTEAATEGALEHAFDEKRLVYFGL